VTRSLRGNHVRFRVATLLVLSAFIAGVQVLASAPAAAMDDNGTDACLPMPGFPGFGTDSDGFCDPLEESGGGGNGGGGGDGSGGGAGDGASGGGLPDEEGGEVIVIVEDVEEPEPEPDDPPQHQCRVRPWECGPDQRGHRDDPFSSMDGREPRGPHGRGGATKPPAKKPKKALTPFEECQALARRGYLLAPYLIKQKRAELERLKRRDAVLYGRWLERRGHTSEDAGEDAEARQIWRQIAALERELERAERAEELDCRGLLRGDFPPS
jgi:hypothetical protein